MRHYSTILASLFFASLIIGSSTYASPSPTDHIFEDIPLVHFNPKYVLPKDYNESHFREKIILTTEEGTKYLKTLQDGLPPGTTTSSRREQKAVLTTEQWEFLKAKLEQGSTNGEFDTPITLTRRDKQPEGGKNNTFTIYGKAVKFPNFGIYTHFTLRVRFYLQSFEFFDAENPDLKHKRIVRSSITQNRAFLEIKMRNPKIDLPFSVYKSRILLDDQSLIKLLTLDSKQPGFKDEVESLKQMAYEIESNSQGEIESIFDVIYKMAKKDVRFIRPEFIVAYERSAFQFTEKNYPIPSYYKGLYPEENKVQYQFTVDENVRFFHPVIKKDDTTFDFNTYYKANSPRLMGQYPENALVIEFKDPFPYSSFGEKDKSPIHQFFLNNLLKKMLKRKANVAGFRPNKGKAGHYRKFRREVMEWDRMQREDEIFKSYKATALVQPKKTSKRVPKKSRRTKTKRRFGQRLRPRHF